MEPHPEENGARTPLGSASSKLAKVNNPDKISGVAKKTTTSGASYSSSLSHRFQVINWQGTSILVHVIDRLKNQFWGLLIAFAFHLSGHATREKEFKIRPEFLGKAN